MRNLELDFNEKNIEEKIQSAKEIFKEGKYSSFDFNLSRLNPIEAAKVVFNLSYKLFCLNPELKINFKLRDYETLNLIAPRKLKNTFLGVNLKDKLKDFKRRNTTGFIQKRRYAK